MNNDGKTLTVNQQGYIEMSGDLSAYSMNTNPSH